MHEEVIKQEIVSKYDFKEVAILDLLQSKGNRYVYKVKLDNTICIAKISSPEKTEEEIKKDTYFFDFSKEKNFDYNQQLVKTKDDSNYISVDNRFLYILEYLDGIKPQNTKENWYEIGKITAELHNLKGYIYQSGLNPENEKIIIQKSKLIPDHIRQDYNLLVNNLPDFKDSKKSIIHTDIGLHNAVEVNKKIFFIDWDDAGIGYSVLDIGYPLLTQFVSSVLDFDIESAKSFYDGYFFSIEDKQKLSAQNIFDASLLFLLMYLPFADDLDNGWGKIQYVLQHRIMFEEFLIKNNYAKN